MSSAYQVTRHFQGAGDRIYKPGEIVDAGSFKHLDLLVAQRRLRPVPAEVEPQKTKVSRTDETKARSKS